MWSLGPMGKGSGRPTHTRTRGWSCSLQRQQCFQVSLNPRTRCVSCSGSGMRDNARARPRAVSVSEERGQQTSVQLQCRHRCSERVWLVGDLLLPLEIQVPAQASSQDGDDDCLGLSIPLPPRPGAAPTDVRPTSGFSEYF